MLWVRGFFLLLLAMGKVEDLGDVRDIRGSLVAEVIKDNYFSRPHCIVAKFCSGASSMTIICTDFRVCENSL